MHDRPVARVLSDIAETASETLELQEVFDRVATSVRELVPFDHMGVVRILPGDMAVRHATTLDPRECVACSGPLPLASWSERLRPRPGSIPRIDDAREELDPSFPGDRDLLARGVRSTLWEPFRTEGGFRGGVWLCASTPHAFSDEHQEFLRPIAALLGSAVEHWKIYDAERRRRERLETLEKLLGTLAEALDVRAVFARISEAIQPILEHDLALLSELDVRASSVRIVAAAGRADVPVPSSSIALSGAEAERSGKEFEIVRDIPEEIAPTTERNRLLVASGMRSWLRVPVRLSGEVHGSLGFFDRRAARFGIEDVEVAARLADRIALMISHHRLAEEARIATEARERAERLAARVDSLTRELQARGQGRVVGVSSSWNETLLQVGRVAGSETTVLLTGESGTGKEVVAHLLHGGSARAGKPFVAINCAALPEQLLESELFGHEKGAFTGAIATKVGRLEQAAGGTLFLDEIGEMSPAVQAKFLRVLEQREFQRLGAMRTLRADVRVIAATNRDLPVAIVRREFREDLYYRLNVFEIRIAPLRERPQDILPLAEAFLEDLGQSMGRPAGGISRDAREWLLGYPWPGNVRELRNAIERAILLCDGGLITRAHLPAAATRPAPTAPHDVALPPGGVELAALDRSYVEKALHQSRGNKSQAARLLGLSRAQLYSRLEKYGLR